MKTKYSLLACILFLCLSTVLKGQTGAPTPEQLKEIAKKIEVQKRVLPSEINTLGLWKGPNGQLFIKWAKSDLFVAIPTGLAPEMAVLHRDSTSLESLYLQRHKKSRQLYLGYRVYNENGRAVSLVRTNVILPDTTKGTPEIWVFRGLQLTEEELKSGVNQLTLTTTSDWVPTNQANILRRPDPKFTKTTENLRKILAQQDTTKNLHPAYTAWKTYLLSQQTPLVQVHTDGQIFESTVFPSSKPAYPLHLIQGGSLASYFYREIIDLLNAYSNSKNPQDRLLLHYDLERLALQFFGPKGGPQLYNSSSDAALFANIILLAEYSTGKQVEPSLLTNPSYEKYRGTQKSTYVFASELLKNSIFTDLNRFEAAISPANFNELGKTLSTDPLALLIGTVETISILSAQSQGLDAKVPQKGAIAIQTASIKRPNKRPYSTANLELTEYFKKLVKANNATDKNEAFGTNLPLLPLNTDETRSKQSRSTKEAPSDSKAPSRPNPGTKKGKGK